MGAMRVAAMEPGERHREHRAAVPGVAWLHKPQWSPVNVTGNTRLVPVMPSSSAPPPQWSPVNVTGNTQR